MPPEPVAALQPPTQPETATATTETDAAVARAAKAQQLFSAVLKETSPLLAQNKFADCIALLERKAAEPTMANAAELIKQEQADVVQTYGKGCIDWRPVPSMAEAQTERPRRSYTPQRSTIRDVPNPAIKPDEMRGPTPIAGMAHVRWLRTLVPTVRRLA